MASPPTFRHELKYRITYADYLALRSRLRTVMKPDPYAGADGRYLIRSIYFDNYRDKALREKLDGVRQREKYRIRWYNDDLSTLRLEKKVKVNSLGYKLSARLTEAETRALLRGETSLHESELVRELQGRMTQQQLVPKVLVSYLREPYVYAPGNVRVTFDTCIRTSLFERKLLDKGVHDVSATQEEGVIIMEVKYDAYLPEIIRALLQTDGTRQTAFSKYGACRRFG